MAVEIITPPEHVMMTTPGAIKAELGITGSEFDSLLEAFILEAGDLVRSITGRDFPVATVLETLSGTGRYRMYLSRTPVQEIEWIKLNGQEIPGDSYFIEDAETGSIYSSTIPWQKEVRRTGLIAPSAPMSGMERLNYAVQYVGGYYMPEDKESRDFPRDIERAVKDVVKIWFLKREGRADIINEKIGDWGVAYISEDDLIRGRLKSYIRVFA